MSSADDDNSSPNRGDVVKIQAGMENRIKYGGKILKMENPLGKQK